MRVIDADELKKQLLDYFTYSMQLCAEISDFIDNAPTIEPERKKGKWIEDDEGYFYCDQCGKYPAYQITQSDCCPNCGADMREDGEAG